MRLEHLRAKNFRAWRILDIRLDDIEIAALVGENGAGKSCLIEAILWVLYGRHRETGANGVVRIGEVEASVELVFWSRGSRYRVVRTRSTKGRGKSEVLFFVEEATDDLLEGVRWVPVGAAGARGTDEAIVEATGLGYDELTNTSVLLHGEADRFSRAQAAERGAILRKLLHLDRWDERAKEASARARGANEVARVAEGRLVAGAEEAMAEAKARAGVKAAEVQAAVTRQNAARAVVLSVVGEVSSARAELAAVEAKAAEAQALAQAAQSLRQRATEARTLAGTLAALEAEHREAVEAGEALADLRANLEGAVATEAAAAERVNQRAVTAARITAAQKNRDAWAAQLKEVPTAEAVAEAEAEAAGLDAARAAVDAAVALRHAAGERGVAAKAEAEALKREAEGRDALQAKLRGVASKLAGVRSAGGVHERTASTLDAAPCVADAPWTGAGGAEACDLAATCPLLSNAREARAALAQLETDAKDLAAEAQALEAEAQALDAKALEAQAAQARVDAVREEWNTADDEVKRLRDEVQRLDHLAAGAAAKRQKIADAAKAKAEVERLDLEVAELVANLGDADALAAELASARAAVTEARAALAKAEALAAKAALLADAVKRARGAEDEAEGLEERAATATAEAEAAKVGPEPARAALAAAEAAQRLAEADAAAADAAVEQARGVASAADRAVERARTVVEANAAALAEAKAAQATALGWERTKRACALAPRLLFEQVAIPAIEARANEYLALFSNRGMVLRIDTLQETNAGTQKETLALVIGDERGERAYEAFSGGEKFRIDFALRLALAALAAERDGVPVEFLIIDEGSFGALDAEGIEAVKQCLASLRGRYHLVLVVTHIEAIAEALPRRITVSVGSDGPRAVLS